VEGDARGFKVALVASEFVNPGAGGLDALAVLDETDWGLIQLPAADYPAKVAAPLLDQAAEQAQEFSRHGYKLAVIGDRDGLTEALDRYGVSPPPRIDPTTPTELRAFLKRAAR
jgi:hypothetical protein